MTMRWEKVERFILVNNLSDKQFNNATLARGLGISTATATDYLQAYLREQNRPVSRTAYSLHRTGRTTGAVWNVGAKSADARSLGTQTADDFKRRFYRCIQPALNRMRNLNPRATLAAETIMTMLDLNVNQLAQLIASGQSRQTTGQPPP